MKINAQLFACGLWFALAVLQVIFTILWIAGVIQWHWAYVFFPLWIFLALPLVSYIGLKILEEYTNA